MNGLTMTQEMYNSLPKLNSQDPQNPTFYLKYVAGNAMWFIAEKSRTRSNSVLENPKFYGYILRPSWGYFRLSDIQGNHHRGVKILLDNSFEVTNFSELRLNSKAN